MKKEGRRTILLNIFEGIVFIGDPFRKSFLFIFRALIELMKLIYYSCMALVKNIYKSISSLKFFIQKNIKSFIKKTKNINKKIRVKKSWIIRLTYLFIGIILTLSIVLINEGVKFVKALPQPTEIGKVNYPLSTHIFDRNDQLLYEVYNDQNRTPIKLKELPPYVINAAIAIEDKDFYKHSGVSIVGGILRAVKDMTQQKGLQGGSTITQQLIKSSLLTPERTIQRKIKEIILALWAERMYTKNQILEMYFNQVPYGGSFYGIEAASKGYFGKSAKNLSLSEAALLAGLPQLPSYYSPYINPDQAVKRRNDVLEKMREQKYITEDAKMKAQKSKLEVLPPKTYIKAPHFVFYVKDQLEKKFGSQQVEEGGLTVKTSLDLRIQQEAEKILKEELEKISYLNVHNGGILVTKPSTGEILVMVGSVDYFASPSGAFNVTTALRQPGSSVKPLMYSLAFEKGYTAASIINDSPVTFNIQGSEPYKPVNYDGKFRGPVNLRNALANSLNIPAVKTLSQIGVLNFIEHAQKMGIDTWNDDSRYGLSLTLGGGEVTMLDMSEAFGVFANQGSRIDLQPITTIFTNKHKLFYEKSIESDSVVNNGVSFIISDILADNQARQMEFGPSSALEIPGYKVSVKTGTTDNKHDNWTVGYTPEFLVAVWVGNNDNTPMNQTLASGITGAAPIWNRTMTYLLKNYTKEQRWFEKPENIVEKICNGKVEYFIRGTETNYCNSSSTPALPFNNFYDEFFRRNGRRWRF